MENDKFMDQKARDMSIEELENAIKIKLKEKESGKQKA